ncbi:MAG: hypothetical protein ACI8Z5_000008 [Lentimonas sp.]|jgi:hypothetical protein
MTERRGMKTADFRMAKEKVSEDFSVEAEKSPRSSRAVFVSTSTLLVAISNRGDAFLLFKGITEVGGVAESGQRGDGFDRFIGVAQ